ncbi:unnamed protein product [Darwinula stevensoni]|uniref:Uncharacterized protein n=1 Tax=Darwinula stevensoni TaxID=69355 RepID=A0A7R9FR47_9CRUS|nr:unnamed protein product [Darwinula stevensoni]CAG0900983.1 unnamed protein product [Darwinula stevensoni]
MSNTLGSCQTEELIRIHSNLGVEKGRQLIESIDALGSHQAKVLIRVSGEEDEAFTVITMPLRKLEAGQRHGFIQSLGKNEDVSPVHHHAPPYATHFGQMPLILSREAN